VTDLAHPAVLLADAPRVADALRDAGWSRRFRPGRGWMAEGSLEG
jgi:hypothetical protein